MNDLKYPGLYLHVPFCRTKCPYCDFYSVTSFSLVSDWLEAVRNECLHYRDRFPGFDSLHLGGGTPTALDDHQMVRLIGLLRNEFSFSGDVEFTVEANPDDLSPSKLELLSDLGVNRISLGAQSFDDQDLLFLKRRHTVQQTERALEWVRGAGFCNVGLDLIYGLPGQTRTRWLHSLDRALGYEPEHISCYQLTLEEHTPLGRMRTEGRILPLTEEEEEAFFMVTSAFLEERGYIHYEISNFARGIENTSRHNVKYWQHAPYLGLGPSAHSYLGNQRWWNVRSVTSYCRILARGSRPIAGEETLSEEQSVIETLMLGFRTRDGIDLDLLAAQSGSNKPLEALEQAGLVEVRDRKVIPTRRGFLVADSLPLLFGP
jgi:oxygen-independent coproporphyrinogen-3 oxidase